MLHHICKRVSTRADSDIISRLQLDPLSPIETRPRACAGIVRDAYAQNNGVGEDDGSEGERMRADGGDEDDGVLGVAEGAPGCEIVGCRAGGCSNTDAVGLNRGEMLVVAKDFCRGHG